MLRNFRSYLLRRKLRVMYPNVIFGSGFYLEDTSLLPHNLKIQEYVYIGANANWSIRGKISIGKNVIFGPQTVIWPYNHNYDSDNFVPYGPKSEDVVKDVVIKDNVWVGRGVLILAGVTIEEGAVVGANSVVTKDIPKCATVAGNPARIIKYRDNEKYDRLVAEKKFYIQHKFQGTL